jgi:hypothetical protein
MGLHPWPSTWLVTSRLGKVSSTIPQPEGSTPLTTQPAVGHETTVKVKVTLRLTVSQSVCLGVEPRLGLMTRCFFLLESYCPVHVGRPLWGEVVSVIWRNWNSSIYLSSSKPSFLLSPRRYSSGWALTSWIISLNFSLFFICSVDEASNGRMKMWQKCGWKRSWPLYFRWISIHSSIRRWPTGSWTI